MTVQKNFRLSEDVVSKLSIIQQKRNLSSETFTVEEAIRQMYDCLDKEQEEPSGIELLKPLLGEELYEQHLQYLEEHQREGETLEDVFKALIMDQFVYYTREQFFQRMKEKARTRFRNLMEEMQSCHYRTIAQDGTWYCDGRKIPPEVCLDRQERYRYMSKMKDNPKIKCKPAHTKRSPQKRAFSKAPQIPQPSVPKDTTLRITCSLKGTTFPIHSKNDMLKLPCMENVMTKCENPYCSQKVMEILNKIDAGEIRF